MGKQPSRSDSHSSANEESIDVNTRDDCNRRTHPEEVEIKAYDLSGRLNSEEKELGGYGRDSLWRDGSPNASQSPGQDGGNRGRAAVDFRAGGVTMSG